METHYTDNLQSHYTSAHGCKARVPNEIWVTAALRREFFWRILKCLGRTWRKREPEPAPKARARSIFLQIQNCGHYTKKFGLISSRIQVKNESPRHHLAPLGNPERKNTSCISDLAGVIFSEKGKGVFLSGFCPPSIWAVWRGEMRTRFCQNYFLGKRTWQNLG